MIMAFVPNMIYAEELRYGDLTYHKYDDHIEITGCNRNVTSVDIPAEIDGLPVTEIGESAFEWCDSLTNVTIPSSVTSIGFGAFLRCESLTSITIPSGVTRIGSGAFHNTAYYNEDSNWQNGVLYIDNCLIEAKGDELSSNYTINSGTRVIADEAFLWCENLTSVVIPNSVTSIGYGVFVGCGGLTNVKIPNSVTSISPSAFNSCGNLNITVDESNPNYCDIDGVLFNKCKTEIMAYSKDKIQPEYSIPDSVTSIGDYAFYECIGITSVTIPESVTSIGENAFGYCTGLAGITIPGSVTSIGDSAFEDCGSLMSITIPSSVIDIGDYAFVSCNSLTSVTIENGVTSIGDRAFAWCESLTNVTIPSSVIDIGMYAFENCTGLTRITIPSGVTTISNNAFSGCTGLTNITVGNTVTSIGVEAFSDCGSLNITVDENNPNYSDIDGVLFNKDKTRIITYSKDKIQPEYSIPEGVTSIGYGAFMNCFSLTSITIPDSITSIEIWAFDYCECLTDVYYSGNEADWQKIIIEGGNDYLTGATIHYNSAEPPRIEVSEPVVEGGSITITAETKNIEGVGELFAVGYDGNKLTASEKLQDGAATLPAEDVQTIKVFCWDSLDTMRPLCEPKTITIK